jgi:hypothetical protein
LFSRSEVMVKGYGRKERKQEKEIVGKCGRREKGD